MSEERLKFFAVLAILPFLMAAKPPPSAIAARCARERSEWAACSTSSAEKRKLSLEGIACADACLKDDPQQSECFYYRAVNRGHLLESRTGQYRTDLKLMMADFEEVQKRHPALDDGGAMRALGYIYLKLPELPIFGGNLSRDLDRAENYALQALNHAPQNPENLKLKGEIDFAKRDYKSARRFFRRALKNIDQAKLPEAQGHALATELKKWIRKVRKKD